MDNVFHQRTEKEKKDIIDNCCVLLEKEKEYLTSLFISSQPRNKMSKELQKRQILTVNASEIAENHINYPLLAICSSSKQKQKGHIQLTDPLKITPVGPISPIAIVFDDFTLTRKGNNFIDLIINAKNKRLLNKLIATCYPLLESEKKVLKALFYDKETLDEITQATGLTRYRARIDKQSLIDRKFIFKSSKNNPSSINKELLSALSVFVLSNTSQDTPFSVKDEEGPSLSKDKNVYNLQSYYTQERIKDIDNIRDKLSRQPPIFEIRGEKVFFHPINNDDSKKVVEITALKKFARLLRSYQEAYNRYDCGDALPKDKDIRYAYSYYISFPKSHETNHHNTSPNFSDGLDGFYLSRANTFDAVINYSKAFDEIIDKNVYPRKRPNLCPKGMHDKLASKNFKSSSIRHMQELYYYLEKRILLIASKKDGPTVLKSTHLLKAENKEIQLKLDNALYSATEGYFLYIKEYVIAKNIEPFLYKQRDLVQPDKNNPEFIISVPRYSKKVKFEFFNDIDNDNDYKTFFYILLNLMRFYA